MTTDDAPPQLRHLALRPPLPSPLDDARERGFRESRGIFSSASDKYDTERREALESDSSPFLHRSGGDGWYSSLPSPSCPPTKVLRDGIGHCVDRDNSAQRFQAPNKYWRSRSHSRLREKECSGLVEGEVGLRSTKSISNWCEEDAAPSERQIGVTPAVMSNILFRGDDGDECDRRDGKHITLISSTSAIVATSSLLSWSSSGHEPPVMRRINFQENKLANRNGWRSGVGRVGVGGSFAAATASGGARMVAPVTASATSRFADASVRTSSASLSYSLSVFFTTSFSSSSPSSCSCSSASSTTSYDDRSQCHNHTEKANGFRRRVQLLFGLPVAMTCALVFAVTGNSRGFNPIATAADTDDGAWYGEANRPFIPFSSSEYSNLEPEKVEEAMETRIMASKKVQTYVGDEDADSSVGAAAVSDGTLSSLRTIFSPRVDVDDLPHQRHRHLSRGNDGVSRKLFALTPAHVDRYPYTNLADVTDPLDERSDTAFYWQIPRSGGTTLKHILGSCLDLVQASRVSRDHCDVDNSHDLEVCRTKFGRFVNVDPSDDPGLRRASDLGLVQSGLVDVVVSSRFLHASSLFDPRGTIPFRNDDRRIGGKGRAFALFRHPVDRAVSTFHYLRHAKWERNYNPLFKYMSLIEYAQRDDTSSNWMVRLLTGKNYEAELTRDDLNFAKLLLKRKFLILLMEDLGGGVDRLIRYMGWENDIPSGGLNCSRAAGAKAAAINANAAIAGVGRSVGSPGAEVGSKEWNVLAELNDFDIELYEYAQALYQEQWTTVFKGRAWSYMSSSIILPQSLPPDMAKLAAAFERSYYYSGASSYAAEKRRQPKNLANSLYAPPLPPRLKKASVQEVVTRTRSEQ